MNKIPVYFVPGLAASPLIFERINLPEKEFICKIIEWKMPKNKETIQEYAKRMASDVTEEDVVLIGVSFGGVMVQEMARFLKVKKLIIISSVKNNKEFPRRMKIAKTTKAYKLIPTQLFENIEALSKFSFGSIIKQRIKLYEKFLSVRSKEYLDWAIEAIILWDRDYTDPKVIHIHGDDDEVFPIKYISNPIVIKGGTHIMILNKYKWLNENLPKIILEKS